MQETLELPILEVQSLKKVYTKHTISTTVLDDISFSVNKGEIFGIIGRSGAGKSTLMKCLNLLEVPSSGKILVHNTDIATLNKFDLRSLRKKISVIFQGFNLLNAKTVFDNIALPLKLQAKFSKQQIHAKVIQLLELVDMYDLANCYPRNLSGGQKQRIGIARALANDPEILLCDEATSALDNQTTNSILDLLLEINQKLKLTIILITHQIDVVRKICDKVAVIDNGKIIEINKTIDIILHPKHIQTRKLILEEETEKYLEQIMDYYNIHNNLNSHLVIISFVGETTFEPILSQLSISTGVVFSILRGELGHIKKMPFGQLLLQITGEFTQINNAFKFLNDYRVHFEIIN